MHNVHIKLDTKMNAFKSRPQQCTRVNTAVHKGEYKMFAVLNHGRHVHGPLHYRPAKCVRGATDISVLRIYATTCYSSNMHFL